MTSVCQNCCVLSSRVLRVVNGLIAVFLVLLAGATYWYAWRPLPQTSGTVQADVEGPVDIVWDALGVPHITSGKLEDALFAQGYVTASERLWQMDGLRRLAGGELAEIAGPAAVESDREARGLRMRRLAEKAALEMPAVDKAALAAYARGVNAFIESHRGSLPLEFSILRYEPRPWTVTDSLLAGLQMVRTLTTSWRDEVAMQKMIKGGDETKVSVLYPSRGRGNERPGSNGWALSGAHTSTGRPILANDMHLEYSIPSTWYMAHLHVRGGMNVSGVTLPGLPGIIVGHNEFIAWGITNLQFDVQDLYREQVDERAGIYRYGDRAEPLRVEQELIRVKGARPQASVLRLTRHGPIVIEDDSGRYSLKWVAAEEGMQFPFIELNAARNWEEFRRALSRLPGPGSNFLYADAAGHIGYQVAGRLPVRRGFTGNLPLDGTAPDNEWQGYIPFEQLPSVLDPASGRIVSANQDSFPSDYPYTVSGNFASPYRARQIEALLGRRKQWRAAEMTSIQTDIYSGFHHFLAGQIVAAFDKLHPSNAAIRQPVDLLRTWNGQMDPNLPQPLIATLAYQHLRRMVAQSASPREADLYTFPMAMEVLESLLRARPSGWFESWDAALIKALEAAVEEATRDQFTDPAHWRYGRLTTLTIYHPVGRNLPLFGKYFQIGPVEMSGSPSSVRQLTRRIGPSMRMAVDLGGWDASELSIPGGQSGHILSGHYKDEWDAFLAGRSFPMQFVEVKEKSRLRLEPARSPK